MLGQTRSGLFKGFVPHHQHRLVHSDGSLVDLSVGGTCQLLLEEEKRGGQREKEEETEDKWMKEEEEEGVCPHVFDRETLSDHITGKHILTLEIHWLCLK